MKTFLVVATEGILDSGLTIILDMLCTAGLLIERNHESQSFRIVTADRLKQIRTGAGLEFSCDYTFQHALQFRRYIFKFVIIVLLGMNLAACERTEQTYYIDRANVIYSKDPSQAVEISIDGYRFSIPSGYLQRVGRWNKETSTFDGYINFEMDAESLLPITKKSRKKIWGGVAPRTTKALGEAELNQMLNESYPNLRAERAPNLDQNGLIGYLANGYEIYVDRLDKGDVIVWRCSVDKELRTPYCENKSLIKELQLTLFYNKKDVLASPRRNLDVINVLKNQLKVN